MESLYRHSESKFINHPDKLWALLEQDRHDDPTLCIGWALERAKRIINRSKDAVVARTGYYNEQGKKIEEPISVSTLEDLLSGHYKATPQLYVRLARACEVSVLEFYIAEGWVEAEDIAAFGLSYGSD